MALTERIHLSLALPMTAVSLLLILLGTGSSGYDVNEYCRWEAFNASCPANKVIFMRTARYGRMQRGRCLNRDYYLGCAADVIVHADSRCSGRRECTIHVPDATLHEVQPCPKDIMAYLEAGYDCVSVANGEGHACHAYTPVRLTQGSGYIASVVTEEDGYGSNYCPWLIKVDPGQRVNLTLFDFSILTFSQDSPICQVYATIKENTRTRDVTVCGGRERQRHLMISDTNEIEIQMVSRGQQEAKPYFMIQYEALGCPNVAAPAGGWATRRGDSLVIGCNGTALKWHLVCKGSKWVGKIKNCTQGSQPWSLGHALSEGNGFPYGLLISVAIGVVLGIVLGTVMLAVVLMCRRRHQKQKQHHTGRSTVKQGDRSAGRPLTQSMTAERGYNMTQDKNATLGDTNTKNGGYAHIWELRQSAMQTPAIDSTNTAGTLERQRGSSNKRSTMASDPGDYNTQTRSGGVGVGVVYPHHPDHVYESPKSTRREDEIYNLNAGPYYHEFDPSDGEGNEVSRDIQCMSDDLRSRNNNFDVAFSIGDE